MWKNSLYNTIGGLIRLGLGLISVPLLTRNLGIEGYGLYAATNAIINIALFSEWSVSSSITVFISKDIASTLFKKVNSLSIAIIYVILLSLITTASIYFSASWIVSIFDNLNLEERTLLKGAIQIGSGVICIRFFIQFFVGVLQANKVYGVINVLSTIYTSATVLSTLYIASTSKDIIMIQTLQLILAIIMFAIYSIYCFSSGYLNLSYFTKPTLAYFINISKYGFRMWIAALGTTFFSQFDRLIILRLLGAEWAGIYSAITSVANQINVVSSMPIQPLLPVLSEYYQKTVNKKVIEGVLIKAFAINASIILLAGCGIILFSEELIAVLFKKGALSVDSIRVCLVIVTVAYSIYSFNAVGYFSLLAIRDEKFVTNLVLVSGVFSLVSIYILSLQFGIVGACIGNLGYSLTLLLNLKAINKLEINRYKLSKSILFPTVIAIIFCFLSLIIYNIYVSFTLYIMLAVFILYTMKDYFDIRKVMTKEIV